MSNELGIGIAGLGTVGSSVVSILSSRAEEIRNRLGAHILVQKVLVRRTKWIFFSKRRFVVEFPSLELCEKRLRRIESPHCTASLMERPIIF